MPIFLLYLNTQTRFPEPPRLGFILVEGLPYLCLCTPLSCWRARFPVCPVQVVCLVVPALILLSPSPSSTCFPCFLIQWPRPVWLCKWPRYIVGFHSSRPSTDPSVGSPPLPGPLHWCLVPLHSSQLPFLFRCVASDILYFPIPHNALCLTPNFAWNIIVKSSREICIFPKVFHNNSFCKTWKTDRVHTLRLQTWQNNACCKTLINDLTFRMPQRTSSEVTVG